METRNHWYKEFGLTPRWPRPPKEDVTKLLKGIQEPEILLRERKKGVDIVIRLPGGSNILPPRIRRDLASFGVTLSRAFEDILWRRRKTERSTPWAELAEHGIKAHREAWLHFFELTYLGHFHPQTDQWLRKIKQQIEYEGTVTRLGRRATSRSELPSLRRRYQELLPKCGFIHRVAKDVVASLEKEPGSAELGKIRRLIWERVRKQVHGMPSDGYIFSGEAFNRIPYGQRIVELESPASWKPRQLAISLLSLERGQKYQTIEKKVARMNRTERL
jgi:hypothetical protein